MEHARTVQNKLWKYTTTIQESTAFHKILYAFEIVSLCSDLKERQAITSMTSIIRSHSSVLTMSRISYKIPKQSPYTPWQYKCSHHEKKSPECEMSLMWYIKKKKKPQQE